MQYKNEYFDVYTIDREKAGFKKQRGSKLPLGFYRLVTHVCIFNELGKMLIQQKAELKKMANIWDFSAGGTVVSGENSRQAIRRELNEEIGYDYDFSNCKPHLTMYFNECIDDIYIIKIKNLDLTNLKLQREEVKNIKWIDKSGLIQMIDDGEFIRYDRSYIDLLFFMNENGEGCVKKLRER